MLGQKSREFFRWSDGRNNYFIRTFWNYLTFSSLQLPTLNFIERKCKRTLMKKHWLQFYINMSYLTDSYISFTLNLESGQNVCSDGRLIRSSTYGKKHISDFPPCGKLVIFVNEFMIFLKTSKWNEFLKNGSPMEEFQKYFFYHMYLT